MNKPDEVLSKKIEAALSDFKIAYADEFREIVPAKTRASSNHKQGGLKKGQDPTGQDLKADLKAVRAKEKILKHLIKTERLVKLGTIAEYYFNGDGMEADEFDEHLAQLTANPDLTNRTTQTGTDVTVML